MKYALPLEEYVQKVHLEEFLRRKIKGEIEEGKKRNDLKATKTKESPQREVR
ncbi:MAG: hypothetical protein PHC81_06320 [Clostridia bacterium]|nr:hypothetical protein [Clostridia bacterium]